MADYKRELELLNRVQKTASNPDSVLATIDKYCWDNNRMMHVGDRKGEYLDHVIQQHQPRRVLELGTYCGYSATRIARLLPDGGHIYTVDPSPLQAMVADKVVAKAGLSERVIFVNKRSDEALQEFDPSTPFDLVFIDHDKPLYLPDLKTILDRGLLKSGGVVVADNVILFNSEQYLDFVRNSGKFSKSELFKGKLEYDEEREDGMEISILA
ncbi:hypothetical protein SpCBS45565_g05114 [Spizellomyces sp. 'palustris']|nr:hypothetical protein SpCBS45565_g05114 [Spizellomyces sp. 'palustris']